MENDFDKSLVEGIVGVGKIYFESEENKIFIKACCFKSNGTLDSSFAACRWKAL
jgi:hypothetical protein